MTLIWSKNTFLFKFLNRFQVPRSFRLVSRSIDREKYRTRCSNEKRTKRDTYEKKKK